MKTVHWKCFFMRRINRGLAAHETVSQACKCSRCGLISSGSAEEFSDSVCAHEADVLG